MEGRRADAETTLSIGDRIVVQVPVGETFATPKIVFEDDDLVVVEKPAGMLAQPSVGESGGALEVLIRAARPTARLMHRLDRDASGLVLFAMRPVAYAAVQHAFARGEVQRIYGAVVADAIAAPFEVRLRIAPDPDDRRRRRALPENAQGGEAAATMFRSVAPVEKGTLLRAALTTGRTHQIRVHLAAIGHPIVGDRLYGGQPADRLLLHAAELGLRHPTSGAPLALRSSLPPEFGGSLP